MLVVWYGSHSLVQLEKSDKFDYIMGEENKENSSKPVKTLFTVLFRREDDPFVIGSSGHSVIDPSDYRCVLSSPIPYAEIKHTNDLYKMFASGSPRFDDGSGNIILLNESMNRGIGHGDLLLKYNCAKQVTTVSMIVFEDKIESLEGSKRFGEKKFRICSHRKHGMVVLVVIKNDYLFNFLNYHN